MSKAKVYSYKKCSTCVKALKFLDSKGVKVDIIDITEQAPAKKELQQMLDIYEGDLKKLFNTSGVAYREGNYKEKISTMTKAQALTELSKNGRLVKRPFVLKGKKGAVGFKQDQWSELF